MGRRVHRLRLGEVGYGHVCVGDGYDYDGHVGEERDGVESEPVVDVVCWP